MNANISVFFICVDSIIYLLLDHLHDCTFYFRLPSNQESLSTLNTPEIVSETIWNFSFKINWLDDTILIFYTAAVSILSRSIST